MTQDIRLQLNGGLWDMVVVGNDIDTVDSFETAIHVSFFTDSRAPEFAQPDPQKRRGWIGNISTADSGRELGSLLWLHEQPRNTQEEANLIRVRAENCLRWMVQDGIAQRVTATNTNIGLREITTQIDIVAVSGETSQYNVIWNLFDADKFSNV